MSSFIERISRDKEAKELSKLSRVERTAAHTATRSIFELEEALLNTNDAIEANKNSEGFDFDKGVELMDSKSKIEAALENARALKAELFSGSDSE